MQATRRQFILLGVLVGVFCGAASAVTQVNLPDWAKTAMARPQKTYPPRTNAVVLLEERTIVVSQPGEYVKTFRRVVRILRQEGKNEGSISIPVSAADKLLGAHIWCASPDGHNYEVREKEFVQRSEFAGSYLYADDVVHHAASVSGANPGAVVAIEYSIRVRTWGDSDIWHVQEDIPVEEARLRLTLPAGWNYKAFWVNSPAIAPTASGNSEWSWEVRDLEPIDMEEKERPDEMALAARLQLAFAPPGMEPVFGTWNSLGKWYSDLIIPRRQATPELTAKVQQLIAGSSGFDETVARIANFAQTEIRYVAIEFGIGGLQPHAAGDVFRNRYGDCKDKANLMGTMLQVAGIPSSSVAIHASHGITNPDAPGHSFNHQILAIELPPSSKAVYHSVVQSKSGKRYLIFDPTNEDVPLGDLPAYEQGNFALLTGKDGGELIRLPVFDPVQNRMERTGKFTIAEGGAVSGELILSSTGWHAMRQREYVRRETELERTKVAERYLSHSLQGVTLKELSFDHLNQIDKELVTRFTFSAPAFLKQAGSLLIFQPCVFGGVGLRLDWKKRRYPVDLSSTRDDVDNFEITLPAGYVVEDLPDPVQVDVGFASYTSTITAKDGVVHYRREYIVRDPEVPLSKLGELRRLEDAIARDESASIVLKKKS